MAEDQAPRLDGVSMAFGVIAGLAFLGLIAWLAVWLFSDVGPVTIPGDKGYDPCATTAFDPAHIGPRCHRR